MPAITLDQLKAELRLTDDSLDDVVEALRIGAIAEATQYTNRTELPNEPDVYQGCVLLARAKFDATTPQEIQAYREAGLQLLTPHRVGMGL